TRPLDPAALETPLAAEEAVRRTVARSLGTICDAVDAALTTGRAVSVGLAGDALREAREFISEASGPPESEQEQERLISTLHALDDTSRLAEIAGEKGDLGWEAGESEDVRARELCVEAMRSAALIADEAGKARAEKQETENDTSIAQARGQLEGCAKALRDLRPAHRRATLSAVATGTVSADEAMTRVDIVRRLEALARHAWLSVKNLT
ncbi:MAG TPA: hypothetical protein VNR40_04765, partial [Steroidobacter sp.]|nr:hypothetical protein [Steroidobacter sp.]